MTINKTRGNGVILTSLIFAMILRIVPLPQEWVIYNPDWVALVVIYWCLAVPERFGVGLAWITGLFCDVLTGRLLGQYALSYCIIAFVCVKTHQRLRVFPPSQQAIIVLFLLLLGQLLIFWTQGIRGITPEPWHYGASSVSGALVWPIVLQLLRKMRQKHRVQ